MAREAARLLYLRLEKEYVNAKKRAAETLGLTVLPSNAEVAGELDRMADEIEGKEREERLLRMRREALRIMKALRDLNPKLVGSVWRGTARRGSDIDIYVYSRHPDEVLERLREAGFEVLTTEWRSKAQRDRARSYFHIHLAPRVEGAEIVVKDPSEAEEPETCAIYGDSIVGLAYHQLSALLQEKLPETSRQKKK